MVNFRLYASLLSLSLFCGAVAARRSVYRYEATCNLRDSRKMDTSYAGPNPKTGPNPCSAVAVWPLCTRSGVTYPNTCTLKQAKACERSAIQFPGYFEVLSEPGAPCSTPFWRSSDGNELTSSCGLTIARPCRIVVGDVERANLRAHGMLRQVIKVDALHYEGVTWAAVPFSIYVTVSDHDDDSSDDDDDFVPYSPCYGYDDDDFPGGIIVGTPLTPSSCYFTGTSSGTLVNGNGTDSSSGSSNGTDSGIGGGTDSGIGGGIGGRSSSTSTSSSAPSSSTTSSSSTTPPGHLPHLSSADEHVDDDHSVSGGVIGAIAGASALAAALLAGAAYKFYPKSPTEGDVDAEDRTVGGMDADFEPQAEGSEEHTDEKVSVSSSYWGQRN